MTGRVPELRELTNSSSNSDLCSKNTEADEPKDEKEEFEDEKEWIVVKICECWAVRC